MATTAPDPTDEFPALYADQTEDVILARLIDWANEGLDPATDGDQWVDVREGGHFRTPIVPVVREFARIYDLMGTEVPMSAFVLWSWEVYLDDLAAQWDVFRRAGTPAMGVETFTAAEGTVISAGTTIGAAPSTPDDPAPEFEVTVGGTIGVSGTIDLDIRATEPGLFGNVAADAITAPSTPLPGVTFTNAAPTIGGTDPENDESLRSRTLEAVKGKGPGAVRDYVRWGGEWPGVGKVTVTPVFDGASTVLVMVTDPNGQPLPTALVDALQTDLDPDPAKGKGTAPVGAKVTVSTSTLLNIDLAVTLEYEAGFSWDGAGGTTAVGPGIRTAINRYLLSCEPGGEVVSEHVRGIFATWPGVHDLTAFTMNSSSSANVAIGTAPAKAPTLHTLAVS